MVECTKSHARHGGKIDPAVTLAARLPCSISFHVEKQNPTAKMPLALKFG
jgi:hypothetical protein